MLSKVFEEEKCNIYHGSLFNEGKITEILQVGFYEIGKKDMIFDGYDLSFWKLVRY